MSNMDAVDKIYAAFTAGNIPAEDLGNMFQFKRDFEEYLLRRTLDSVARAKQEPHSAGLRSESAPTAWPSRPAQFSELPVLAQAASELR